VDLLLPPASPFSRDFLSSQWPLLLAACSVPRDPAKVASLASEVRDWDALFRLAEEHGVIAHLADALASVSSTQVPSSLLANVRERHRLQILFALTMSAELFRILDLLRDADIKALVIKGPALSVRAYGDSAVRKYVDLDLLIRHRDIQRAVEIVSAAGYESHVPLGAVRAGKIPGEYLFRRPQTKIIFELHTEHTFRYYPRRMPIEEYFLRGTSLNLDGHEIPSLSAEDEFVLICIHGAKHFWERLMWICDIAAMVHSHQDLDWAQVRRSAQDVGADRMVRLALLLAHRLLDVPVPQGTELPVAVGAACLSLVNQIQTWLPYAGYAAPPVMQRALFRFRMRGSLLGGANYLARLSFSTTEEDWSAGQSASKSNWLEMLRRPFRLAKKHKRNPDQ
jgi:hypothetical protein